MKEPSFVFSLANENVPSLPQLSVSQNGLTKALVYFPSEWKPLVMELAFFIHVSSVVPGLNGIRLQAHVPVIASIRNQIRAE